MLELKEFISETLTNIVEGIELANDKHKRFQISGGYHEGKGIRGELVEFDISVIAKDETKKGAKGRLGIFVISGDIGGSKEHTQQSTNHIKFRVFVTEK